MTLACDTRKPAAFTPAPVPRVLQRKCACGGTPDATGECAQCRAKRLQREAAARYGSGGEAPGSVHEVLRSSGSPLDSGTRGAMERRFGHDFGSVRVHADSRAAASAQDVSARAYTVGSHVVFGAGEYRPGTQAGQRLLAHELAHVVQQGGGGAGLRRMPEGLLQRAALHTGKILDEGSCEHLACNSKWSCEDDATGTECPDGTRNAYSRTKHKYRPLFTCDTKCENGHTCSDDDNWMAVPLSTFSRKRCGEELVICVGGKQARGRVRDRSHIEAYEVSHGVQDALGLSKYGTITGGAVYTPGDKAIATDSRCGEAKAPAEEKTETPAVPVSAATPERNEALA